MPYKGDVFDIRQYGACPDGKTLNTAVIQKAIDACHAAGGGRVFCGPGDFLTGTFALKSNVELHLSHGCRIAGSCNLADYEEFSAPGFCVPNGQKSESRTCLLRAINAENIAVTGPGEINGHGPEFFYNEANNSGSAYFKKPDSDRPRMVMFFRCRRVRIENAAFIDCPYWTFRLMQCEDVLIRGVRVQGDQRMINNDGLDIDACRNVTVSDSVFKTGDDCLILRAIQEMYDTPAVCENVTVTNCVLDSWCQGIRVGCPSDAVIRNCAFSNIVVTGRGNGITCSHPRRYLNEKIGGTADISNIMFANFVIDCGRRPVKFDVEDGVALKCLAGFSFANFRAKGGAPLLIQGSPQTFIRDVVFSNIAVETTGADAVICRNCDGVTFDNVALSNHPAVPAGADGH